MVRFPLLLNLIFVQIFSLQAQGSAVVNISATDFNGRQFGEQTYYYSGDEDRVTVITSAQFQKFFFKGTR